MIVAMVSPFREGGSVQLLKILNGKKTVTSVTFFFFFQLN